MCSNRNEAGTKKQFERLTFSMKAKNYKRITHTSSKKAHICKKPKGLISNSFFLKPFNIKRQKMCGYERCEAFIPLSWMLTNYCNIKKQLHYSKDLLYLTGISTKKIWIL